MATRSEYLSALLAQKKGNVANGGSLVNQGSGLDADQMQSAGETSVSQTGDGSFWSKAFGAIDETAARFGTGWVKFFEGGLDLGATALSALGDWTGWYDGSVFSDWAKQDLASEASKFVKTYANFTPWGIIGNILNGNYSDADYWKNAASGFANVASLGIYDEGKTYDDDVEKYYAYQNGYSTQAGEVVGNIAQTIGYMLPTIMFGGMGVAGGMSQTGAKILSTVLMGASAAGSGAEEALNEGSDASHALLYGAAAGAVEAGTEWLPFDKVLGSSGSVGGVSGIKAALGKKTFAQVVLQIGKEATEEGLEEVAGEVVQPFIDVLKGNSEFKYDFGEVASNSAKAFAMAAATTLIMGGASDASRLATYGREGSAFLEDANATFQGIQESYEDFRENNGTSKGMILQEYLDQNQQAKQAISDLEGRYKAIPKDVRDKIAKAYSKELTDSVSKELRSKGYSREQIEDRTNTLRQEYMDDLFKHYSTDMAQRLADETGVAISDITGKRVGIRIMTDEQIKEEYQDQVREGETIHAFDDGNGHIVIRQQDAVSDYYGKVAHEVTHEFFSKSEEATSNLIKSLEENKAFSRALNSKAIAKTIIGNYESNFRKQIATGEDGETDYSATLKNIKANARAKALYEQELLAHFVESQITDSKTWRRLVKSISSYSEKNRISSMLTKIRNSLSKDGELYKRLGKAISEVNAVDVRARASVDDALLANKTTWREKVILVKNKDGSVTERSGREMTEEALTANLRKLSKNGTSKYEIKAKVDAALKAIDDAIDTIDMLSEQFPSVGEFSGVRPYYSASNPGELMLSCVVKNGEYELNIDFSTICKRREALTRFLQDFVDEGFTFGKEGLTKAKQMALRNLLNKYDLDTACSFCFVESRRGNIDTWSKKFVKLYNDALLNSFNGDKNAIKKLPRINSIENLKGVDEINGITDQKAFDVACVMEADALAMKELLSERNVNTASDIAAKNGKIRRTTEYRMAEALDSLNGKQLYRFTEDDLTNVKVLTYVKAHYPELFSVMLTSYGANCPKATLPGRPYSADLLLNKEFTGIKDLRKYTLSIGGIRVNSFSDFNIAKVVDYLNFFLDASAKNAAVQAYTKELAMVEIFGACGAKINMSLIPEVDQSLGKDYAGLERNDDGTYDYYFGKESVDFKKAIELQDAEENDGDVGTCLVGISKYQMIKALADERIKMIIPYHASGMPKHLKIFFGHDMFTNYEPYQATMYYEGGKWHKFNAAKDPFSMVFYKAYQKSGGNSAVAAQAYLDYCEKKHLKPRFALEWDNGKSFKDNIYSKGNYITSSENYYKVLVDFNSTKKDGTYKRQDAVDFKINVEKMKAVIEREAKEAEKSIAKYKTAKTQGILKEFSDAISGEIDVDVEKAKHDAWIKKQYDEAYGKGNVFASKTVEKKDDFSVAKSVDESSIMALDQEKASQAQERASTLSDQAIATPNDIIGKAADSKSSGVRVSYDSVRGAFDSFFASEESAKLVGKNKDLAKAIYAEINLGTDLEKIVSAVQQRVRDVTVYRDGKAVGRAEDVLSWDDMETLSWNVGMKVREVFSEEGKATKMEKALQAIEKSVGAIQDAYGLVRSQKRIGDLNRAISKAKDTYRRAHESEELRVDTKEDIALHQIANATTPFQKIHFHKNSNTDLRDFRASLSAYLEKYTPENYGDTPFGYSACYAQLMDDAITFIREDASAATEDELRWVSKLIKPLNDLIDKAEHGAEEDRINSNAVKAQFDKSGMSKDKGTSKGLREAGVRMKEVAGKAIAYIDRADSYIKNHIVGQDSLAAKQVDSIVSAVGKAGEFSLEYRAKASAFFRKAKLHKLSKATVNVDGRTLPFKSALKAYVFHEYMGEDTTNKIDADIGIVWTNGSGVREEIRFKDQSEADSFYESLGKAIQGKLASVKSTETAESIVGFLENDLYGDDGYYERSVDAWLGNVSRTDVEMVERGAYLPNTPAGSGKSNLESGRIVGGYSNTHLKARRGRSSYGLDASSGLFDDFIEHSEKTSTSAFVNPETRKLNAMMQGTLNSLTATDRSIVRQFVQQALGAVKPVRGGFISNGVVVASVANPKTWLTQTLSYYTAGIDVRTMVAHAAAINAQAIKPTGEYAGYWSNMQDLIPELKSRGKDGTVMKANGASMAANALTTAIGKPISAMDIFTVRKVVIAKGIQEFEQYRKNHPGARISDKAFAEYAVASIEESYRTQINSNRAQKSPLQMGVVPWAGNGSQLINYASLVFRPYTGAATAFFSYVDDTVSAFIRFRNGTIEEYESAIESASEGVKAAESKAESAKSDYDLYDRGYEQRRGERAEAKEALDKARSKAESKSATQEDKDAVKPLESAYGEAKATEQAAKELKQEAKARLEAANGDLEAAKGAKLAAENARDAFSAWKSRGGSRRMLDLGVGAIVMGMFSTLLSELAKRLKGKKDWDEWDVGEMLSETVLNSSVGMVPVVRTIVSRIKDGYDITDPTSEAFGLAFDVIDDVKDLIQNGYSESSGKALLRSGIEAVATMFGIPAKAIYDYSYGVIKTFSPEAALAERNLFYNVRSTASSELSQAIEDGDTKAASAYLKYALDERVGSVSSSVQDEMLRLLTAGQSVLPSAPATSYSGADGETVTISWSDQQSIKRYYQKANAECAKLVASAQYKALSDSAKAKAIRNLYGAYRGGSLLKVLGSSYQGSATKIQALAASGSENLAAFASAMAAISEMESGKKTKKEQAVAYANRLPMSKGQRLIVLWLAGYSVDEDALKSALRKEGLTSDEIGGLI